MSKLLLFLFLLPGCASAQPAEITSQAELSKAYVQAIGDFIKAANKKNSKAFDSLFLLKRNYGQADDFPDIKLPNSIENTPLCLISPETAKKTAQQHPSRSLINLVGWVNKEQAEFIFIVFSNGFGHQYDCSVNYTYNSKQKAFELVKLQFKGPPFER